MLSLCRTRQWVCLPQSLTSTVPINKAYNFLKFFKKKSLTKHLEKTINKTYNDIKLSYKSIFHDLSNGVDFVMYMLLIYCEH
jgi:hypothetical protein